MPSPAHAVRVLLVGLLAAMPLAAAAVEPSGIHLDDRTKVGISEVVLNGAGLRKKVLLKVYVASPYLAKKRNSPAEVSRSPVPNASASLC